MKYEALRDMWRKQREKYQEWSQNLLEAALVLKDELEDILGTPKEGWKEFDNLKKHSFVELVNLNEKGTDRKNFLTTELINDKGELVFGIGIYFSQDYNTYPKQLLYVNNAIRYNNNKIEYSLYDVINEKADQWTEDSKEICKKIIECFEINFKFDPFEEINKRKIGFIGEL